MALQHFLCGWTLMILLSNAGCRSQTPACGRAPEGENEIPGATPSSIDLVAGADFLRASSLISANWILTAASSFIATDHADIMALVPKNLQGESMGWSVDKVVKHPDYDTATQENNIAVVRLKDPVPISAALYPTCLPKEGSVFPTRTEGTITYKRFPSDVVQQVNAIVLENKKCKTLFPSLTKSEICAVAQHRLFQTVAPGITLETRYNNVSVLIGIASDSGAAKTGIYTRVSEYIKWIEDVTSENEPGNVGVEATLPSVEIKLGQAVGSP